MSMASRSQRRRRAALKRNNILAGIAQAARSSDIAKTVRANLASPIIHSPYERIPTSIVLCEQAGASRGGSFKATTDRREKPCKRWS